MANNWSEFRNLCRYYSDCLKYEDKSQDCLYLDKKGISFMLPVFPINWYQKTSFEINTSKDDIFIKRKMHEASDENELYIGYPLHVTKTYEGTERFFPIIILPISISNRDDGYSTGLKIEIDKHGISINHEWLERYVEKEDHELFLRSCEFSNDEYGNTNIDLLLNFISKRFKVDNLSPNQLDYTLLESKAINHILNTAVIYIGSKTKYTKNLLYELRKISNEPDCVLDQTALAYVFRNPPLPNSLNCDKNTPKRTPVSFTKRRMNAGQFKAVEKALNYPLVKVVGPPGTGKSFMAVNLIANEVINNGQVLFTSKNHKAVHAIFDKVSEAISDEAFPLVEFCTVPDNRNNIDWRKSQEDVDIRIDKANAIRDSKLDISFCDDKLVEIQTPYRNRLDIALSRYRDAEIYIDAYQRSRDVISRFEQLLEEIERQLAEIPLNKRNDTKTAECLEKINDLLNDTHKPSFWDKLLIFIKNFCKQNNKETDFVFNQLKEIAPESASVFFSKETIKKDVQRKLRVLKFRSLLHQWENEEIAVLKNENSKYNYEDLMNTSKKAIDEACSVAQKAYRETILNNLYSLNNSDQIVDKCKNYVENLNSASNLDFMRFAKNESSYSEVISCFRQYLKIYPAWATVMLSVNHASPCLPGIYSLAIIDEASQCEIPPMIPVLYRSKRITIIGDPDQFPPVITLKEKREKALRNRYKIDNLGHRAFLYKEENSVFSVAKEKSILLNEHFRCTDDIAEYFNSEFYNGKLTLCCEDGRGSNSSMINLKRGKIWVEASGGDDSEIEASITYLKELKKSNFKGSIGLISPLKRVVEKLQTEIANNKNNVPCQIDVQSDINTANGFQGGERDVILFLLGLNNNRKRGDMWYITSPEKKYIYNVSVSRAKRLFVTIGDKNRVNESGIPYIQKLIPEMHKTRNPIIGPGEILLKHALENVGITTEQQYPIAGRYLDLAIPSLKIDIEVDGQAWHLDANGCRKADDIHRDFQLEAAGWHVLRFWHHEITNDINKCVMKVKEKIKLYSKRN